MTTGLKSAFFLLILIATIATAISLFTPGWRFFDWNGYNEGIVTNHYADYRQTFEKWVIAFMIVALIIEIIVLILSAIGYAKLSNPGTYFTLTGLTFLIGVFLALAIIIYAAGFDDNPGYGYYNYNAALPGAFAGAIPAVTTFSLGYSFWLAVVAFLLILIGFIVGIVTAIRVKRELAC